MTVSGSPPPRRFGGWTPPPRPEWLARVIDEGACMDLRAVVPFF